MFERLGCALTALLLLTACGDTGPDTVTFAAVDLPDGSSPVTMAVTGDDVVVGVRREGQPTVPGLLHRGADGALNEIPVRAASPYGQLARWVSLSIVDSRVVALGGERGGAHGNVLWSVWGGSLAEGIEEQPQGFSTFGGYGAGDLVGAVQTPEAALLVGSWEGRRVGMDAAVWTPDGDTWNRRSSAGTALESTPDALAFPTSAAAHRSDVLVAGWELAGTPVPVVWRLTGGEWTKTALPDAGSNGAASAIRCQDNECAVSGRVDGKLALWRLTDERWERVGGAPPVEVNDKDKMTAPIWIDGHVTHVYTDDGRGTIAQHRDGNWVVRQMTGPAGTVTDVISVGNSVYVLAGQDENDQTLWRADITTPR
ncbi:MAG: hypothetical protein M3548_03170 [Actinomycetota bacterium]|nr:hypothetical protein [Actinomycetota bacterium]